jgi:hypothetical protein
MTELVQYQPRPVAVADASALHAWVDAANAATTVAITLARTPFVPQSLRAVRTSKDQTPEEIEQITVGNVVAAMLTGQELGLQPMASLRSVDVINGTPALRAITQRALVQSHGHKMWLVESTQTRAVVRGQRHGTEPVQESVWTMDRARQLGVAGRDQWRKQPAAMLVARATGELSRLIAADVLMAVPYNAEELSDGVLVETVETQTEPAATPAPRTAQRRRRALTPVPAPAATEPAAAEQTPDPDPFDDEPATAEPPPPEPEPEPAKPEPEPEPSEPEPEPPAPEREPPARQERPMITAQQRAKLLATLNAAGVRDRGERLAVCAAIVDRRLDSANNLTREETSAVIDTIESLTRGTSNPRAELLAIAEEGPRS